MGYNLEQNIEYCRVIVEEFSGLLYYSHIPSAAVALLIGFFVFWKNKDSLLAILLLIISVLFTFWSALDLAIWMNYAKGDIVMAAWAPIELIAVLIFVFCLYFVYVFTDGKDVSLSKKLIWTALVLPMILVLPTVFNLEGYDIQECIATESTYYQLYYRALKIIFSVWIVFTLIRKYIETKGEFKKQIMFLGLGMTIFILSFFVAGYVSDTTFDYSYEMYGLFAMAIFMAFLAYLIVKFKTFHLKLFGAQVLIISLIILIGSQFAFIQTTTNKILTSVTLIITGLIGINLIRSVRKEIEAKKHIEKLAGELQTANEGQQNLIHIINHQIKGYLAKARNIFSELLNEPSYGPVSDASKPMLEEGFKSLTEGVDLVKDFLDASNIERGSYAFSLAPLDFRALVEEMAEKEKSLAEDRKLSYEVKIENGDYNTKGDKLQLGQAVKNLIDNSIRYTLEGGLSVNLSRKDGKILFSVKDTGVGLSEELKPKLFTQGGRDKNSIKININSTGFGLSFVKSVVEAHKGRVWAESDGPNKGSTFYMELPV
ncbi:MAG: ATP-binding protein [Minisyncoccia bacterium]